MHPYVYKKHHKTYQLLVVVTLLQLMILNQSAAKSDCAAHPIKKIKIYSDFSNGFVRVEDNKVIANGSLDPYSSSIFLYQVTIQEHYVLLYHIDSKRFICWNKKFRKLVPKLIPKPFNHCKFEETVSKAKVYESSLVRYVSKNKNREVEMRFNSSGTFAKPKFIEKCVKKYRLDKGTNVNFLSLNPAQIKEGSDEMEAYVRLMNFCANPNFLTVIMCPDMPIPDLLAEFCKRMEDLSTSVTKEIKELCKNHRRHSKGRNRNKY